MAFIATQIESAVKTIEGVYQGQQRPLPIGTTKYVRQMDDDLVSPFEIGVFKDEESVTVNAYWNPRYSAITDGRLFENVQFVVCGNYFVNGVPISLRTYDHEGKAQVNGGLLHGTPELNFGFVDTPIEYYNGTPNLDVGFANWEYYDKKPGTIARLGKYPTTNGSIIKSDRRFGVIDPPNGTYKKVFMQHNHKMDLGALSSTISIESYIASLDIEEYIMDEDAPEQLAGTSPNPDAIIAKMYDIGILPGNYDIGMRAKAVPVIQGGHLSRLYVPYELPVQRGEGSATRWAVILTYSWISNTYSCTTRFPVADLEEDYRDKMPKFPPNLTQIKRAIHHNDHVTIQLDGSFVISAKFRCAVCAITKTMALNQVEQYNFRILDAFSYGLVRRYSSALNQWADISLIRPDEWDATDQDLTKAQIALQIKTNYERPNLPVHFL